MSNHRSNTRNNPRTAPRNPQVIDPLLRLQQLEQRRSPLPPPTPGTRPAPPRQAAAPRPTDAPRPTRLPAAGGVSAEANARLAALQARKGAAGARPGARPAGKKGKPAQGAKVASVMLSALATGGLAAMFAQNSQVQGDSIVLTGGTAATVATVATTPTTATAATTAAATGVTTAATTATTAAATTGQILDGTYVGDASNNRWGTVQVQAVYSGGQLVDVQILSYPDGDGRSVRINQYALPTLISEAVSAQSADVRSVSGATYTSKSYKSSLQSAIDAAKAASGLS